MLADITLGLRDCILSMFKEDIDSNKNFDLYGALKEAIFIIDSKYSRDNSSMAKVKEYLYDIKKIRNHYAHLDHSTNHETELSHYLRVKEFLEYIYSIPKIDKELCTNITKKVNNEIDCIGKRIFTKQENSLNQRIENIAGCLSRFITKSNEIYGLVLNLDYGLKEDDFVSDKIEAFMVVNEEEEYNSIMEYLQGKNEKETELDIYMNSYQGNEDIIAMLRNIIDVINKKNNNDINNKISRVKKDIDNGIKEDALRRELIDMREEIINDVAIERSKCILRKSLIDYFIRYSVNSYDKYNQYISDLVNDKKKEQEKYLDRIFKLVNKYNM